MRRVLPLLVGALALGLAGRAATQPPPESAPSLGSPALARIVVDGSINPAVAAFLDESIARAVREGAPALVVQLDTPGGLLQSARTIVKALLGAPLPVIVWVAPSGAGAGSAGVFVTMAAHVAAMAPGTSIGAAHPVGGQGEDIPGAMGEKVENFTASFSEAIARQRGRNVEWAVKAVRESVSITADEAAKIHVVDLVAKDLGAIVRWAEGKTVEVAGVQTKLALDMVLDADGQPRVHDYEMRLAQRVLNVLADPNLAYLLLMAGLVGLYVELTHPGFGLPGVAGAICLLLALTALQVLPVNYGALALLLLGVVLLVAEAFVPTFGALAVGGLVALVLGSLFLFDTEGGGGVAVARSLIVSVAGTVGALMLIVSLLVVRTQFRKPTTGSEGMLGLHGEVRQRLAPQGMVLVAGEYWSARSDVPIEPGTPIEVTGIDGLVLHVRPVGTATT
ncbi:MAG: nodulation protein NfeD [bacterium]|nr:nodulation protein NfeD [bacterium]